MLILPEYILFTGQFLVKIVKLNRGKKPGEGLCKFTKVSFL